MSGGLTYASLVILGSQIGFTLTLAGIAGFIVAVGITADSFVVLFERIKDEVHEGRTMRVAVPRAWIRARRTIISADIVSFLAAAVLYEFAAGDVRGFAFTLGMSTILDLVVVFLFTHPLVSLLSRSAAFGSARFTGLNAVREGGIAQSAPTAQDRRRAVATRRVAVRRAAPDDRHGRPRRLTSSIDDESGRRLGRPSRRSSKTTRVSPLERRRSSRPRRLTSTTTSPTGAGCRTTPAPGPRPNEPRPAGPGCARRRDA